MRNNTGSRFQVGAAERLRLVGFVLLWIVLWGAMLTQVVVPLERLGLRKAEAPATIEQAISGWVVQPSGSKDSA